jgi:hypothetical protein
MEALMAEVAENSGKPARQSSPRYPFISLTRALERAETLRQAAGTNFALAADVRTAWGYGPKSSGGDQTLAALSYYGLIEDSGTGDVRKVKLSDPALRYLRDERPEVRKELTSKFALAPKAMQNLWAIWKHEPPSDAIARSILKNDLNYSDWAAGELLGIYRENLRYISGGISPESLSEPESSADAEEKDGVGERVDHGVRDKLDTQDDGKLFGAATEKKSPVNALGTENELSVLMSGGRLKISANVDAEGLQKLKEILSKYEEILRLSGS